MYAASIFAAIGLVACGGNSNNNADAEKAKKDSLERIEAMKRDSMEKALAELNAPKDIVTTASADDRFSTLVELIGAANLASTLQDESKSFTVFAPTNDAFAAFDQKKLADLKDPKNADKLKDVLLQHVVVGSLKSGDVNGVGQLQALNDKVLTEKDGTIGGANIVQADIEATNGYIHAIDKVLTPPAAKSTAKPKKPVVNTNTNTNTAPSTGDATNDKLSGKGSSSNTVEQNTNNKLSGKSNSSGSTEDKTNSKLSGNK